MNRDSKYIANSHRVTIVRPEYEARTGQRFLALIPPRVRVVPWPRRWGCDLKERGRGNTFALVAGLVQPELVVNEDHGRDSNTEPPLVDVAPDEPLSFESGLMPQTAAEWEAALKEEDKKNTKDDGAARRKRVKYWQESYREVNGIPIEGAPDVNRWGGPAARSRRYLLPDDAATRWGTNVGKRAHVSDVADLGLPEDYSGSFYDAVAEVSPAARTTQNPEDALNVAIDAGISIRFDDPFRSIPKSAPLPTDGRRTITLASDPSTAVKNKSTPSNTKEASYAGASTRPPEPWTAFVGRNRSWMKSHLQRKTKRAEESLEANRVVRDPCIVEASGEAANSSDADVTSGEAA